MSPHTPYLSNAAVVLVLSVLAVSSSCRCHMPAGAAMGTFHPPIMEPPPLLDPRAGVDQDDRDGDDLWLGSRKTLSVKDYGAVGNGVSDDTRAFRNAWRAACSSTSEKTTLKIPEDYKYSVRPMTFSGPCTSNVTFRVMGSLLPHRSFFSTFWRSLQPPQRWLYFQGLSNVSLRGRGVGTINALGTKWWMKTCKRRSKKPCQPSTVAVAFHNCRYVKVRNMTLLDSPGPHLLFTNSYHVKVSGVKIRAPADSPRNAGVEIVGTRTVYIQNSRIATGDDCISVGAGSSKVRVRSVACESGHGISIGSLGKSNSWAKVNDVQVDGALLSNVNNGLWIKTWQGGQGFAEEISFQNVRMNNVANPIVVDQYYCDGLLHTCGNKTRAVRVSRVSFVNIMGTSATERAMAFYCSDALPCRSILLRDIRLSLADNTIANATAATSTSYCWKASGFSYGLVEPPSCLATQDDYPIAQKVHSTAALLSSAR